MRSPHLILLVVGSLAATRVRATGPTFVVNDLGDGHDANPGDTKRETSTGDVNGDGSVNVSDVFFLINDLFAGGSLPPGLANVNGDSTIDVGDVFYLINALFAGGLPPNCQGT
jgi:hypothetical protein